jgi:hypothetical protein
MELDPHPEEARNAPSRRGEAPAPASLSEPHGSRRAGFAALLTMRNYGRAAASAWSRSAIRSPVSSSPMESLTLRSKMPSSARTSGESR